MQKNNIIKLINNKFVKEKSKQNNCIGKKDIIWNCSKGVINILLYYCSKLKQKQSIFDYNIYWDKRT